MNPLSQVRACISDTWIVIALVVIGIVGAVSLTYLRRRGTTLEGRRHPRLALLHSTLAATLLVIPTIVFDIFMPFPKGINVSLPEAALFYPIIGLVAEIALHLVPLALLVFFVRLIAGKPALTRRQLLACLILVACAEPAFQVAAAWHYVDRWVIFYLAVQLFVLSLVQLEQFRRHGFLAMYAVRLVYYMYWHIAWGALRLELIF